MTDTGRERRRKRLIWAVASVATCLHAVADPIATILAIDVFGVATEANPFIQWLLNASTSALVGAHVGLILFVVIICRALVFLMDAGTPGEATWVYRATIAFFLAASLWGVVLVANSLWLIVRYA